ncbi:ketopantoate reductase family protein [Halomonas halocynthiae]|uniref:ketopantoate reductase family protein n=1 Tax=Halomonas halocynthiae TaxID=176290 RepID=UPI00040A0439|nr:2-dehydropantoate 2-reductase [Halomonas halocynthiae]
MKIAIIGAGAMGCLFAARLMSSGNAVHLIDVDPVTLSTIGSDGIRLNMEGRCSEQVRVPIHRAGELREDVDLVLILTKGSATETAISASCDLVGANTWVMTLQNGLGNASLLAKHVKASQVLQGITTIAADLMSPGVVNSGGQGVTHWWRLAGEKVPFMAELNDVLVDAGLYSYLDAGIEAHIWEKVAFNAALNGLCTLLDCAVGELVRQPQGQQLIEDVVRECYRVARQDGVAFDQTRVLESITHAIHSQGHHLPSMLQDRRAGRSTEVESIQGAIVRIAKRHHMETPVLETLYRLLLLGEV